MILPESKLNERLNDWRREYGPGRVHLGSSGTVLSNLIDHKGFLPNPSGYRPVPIHTAADEVEAAVVAMAEMKGEPNRPNLYFRAAMVLRCEYLTPEDWPDSERLDAMGRIGMSMSLSTYRAALQFGRGILAAALAPKKRAVPLMASK